MKRRTARRVIIPLLSVIALGAALSRTGWLAPRRARAQEGAGAVVERGRPAVMTEDEKAIRAADDGFVADYNRGDSKALAQRFTEDAEIVELDGLHYQGRALIERRLAETFEANPGQSLALEIEAVRMLHPDVAKEEGISRVTPAQGKGTPESRHYTVLYVKREGRWLLSSVREELDPMVRPHDRLKELEWMIGDWIDEASDSEVRFNCRWSEDENFLIRSFTVKQRGATVMTVTQRIGWDPVTRRIRSWEFDSEGGFGEGTWSRDGARWVIKHEGVRPEGTTASATNTMTRERPDRIRWVSMDRVLGSDALGDDESYVLVRVAPAPRLPLKVKGTGTGTDTGPGPGPASPSSPAIPNPPAPSPRSPR